MIVYDLIEELNKTTSTEVYIIIPSVDLGISKTYDISEIYEGSLVYYKQNWEFREEVEEILKKQYFDDVDEVNKEMAKIVRKGIKKGIFIVMMPEF